MAWWALYNWFVQFRKTPYDHWIFWYKKYLYDEWFNSLSEDEQRNELKRIRLKEEKRKIELERLMNGMAMMYSTMDRLTGGKMYEITEAARMVDKISYHPSKYW